MITTSVCACASFAFLCIAVATDYWLYMFERHTTDNGTTSYNSTYTGLWRKCQVPSKYSSQDYIIECIYYRIVCSSIYVAILLIHVCLLMAYSKILLHP